MTSSLSATLFSKGREALSWKLEQTPELGVEGRILQESQIIGVFDSSLAVQAGVAGIIVSNHGARQLDFVLPSIMALEEVVKAVEGRIPVLLDGGVRRGTDIFKALALGAQAVLIGRPILYGLATDGERGVKKVLQMLSDEFELAMSLNGCCSIKDIKRSHVQTAFQMFASKL
ncbi:hypothetical protein L7F22_049912 [Adiantum nelumboides]|nr:hypothetical protein [Adiantum nelumboides]